MNNTEQRMYLDRINELEFKLLYTITAAVVSLILLFVILAGFFIQRQDNKRLEYLLQECREGR